jgi:hypothetical protein
MITSVVPPLLPHTGGQVAPGPWLVRRPLPLPSLISRRTSTLVYGLAALDDRGRIADHVIMRALGWSAGLRVAVAEASGILTVHTDPAGDHQVTNQGHFRIPAPLRHRCGLAAGDRVLLAADPNRSRLTIYPPAALDASLAQTGGEPA